MVKKYDWCEKKKKREIEKLRGSEKETETKRERFLERGNRYCTQPFIQSGVDAKKETRRRRKVMNGH